jgi:hypothetical protein
MRTAEPSRARRAAVVVFTLMLFGSLLTAGYAVAAAKKSPCKRSCTTTDTMPPSISITAPTGGSTVTGSVTVSGTATDDVGVAAVAVSIDAGPYSGASGAASWSIELDTAIYANGTHTINARATDTSGNVKVTSETITVSNLLVSLPSPTPTLSPSPFASPSSSSPSQSSTATHMVTPEGVSIDINSAGGWTTDQIYSILKANALDLSTVGPHLTIEVQDTYSSQTSTGAVSSGGHYVSFSATIYLKGVNSNFALSPDAGIAHEYGHAWTLYNLYMTHNGDWSSFLSTRWVSADGSLLGNDSLLDTSYTWMRSEIIADDYRLLFGTTAAINEAPTHLNTNIIDPRAETGLQDWMLNSWR